MSPDGLLVLSFGGPNGPEDVLPFLKNVTRGRNVPESRLATVAEQYALFGGRSPINEQNLALIDAVAEQLNKEGIDLPIYFGNRNWTPFVADTVAQMGTDGVKHALVFVTSAFGSYSGCRQYREDLASAAEATDGAPILQKLRLYYNHPYFVEAVVERIAEVYESGQRLIFTAHSVPVSMAAACDYEAQLRETAELVVNQLGHQGEWDLVFQSRSGPPQVQWLEPDICDHLRHLGRRLPASSVCVVPLGFVSDHTEVLFDLDHQAAAVANELEIPFVRAKTVGTHSRFVQMVVELIKEQIAGAPRLSIGSSGPWPDRCPEGHCYPATEIPNPGAGAPTPQ